MPSPNQAWLWLLAVHSRKRETPAKEGAGLSGLEVARVQEAGIRRIKGVKNVWNVNGQTRKNKGFVQMHPWCGHSILEAKRTA